MNELMFGFKELELWITEEKLNYDKMKAKEIERMQNGYLNFLRKKETSPNNIIHSRPYLTY